MAEGRVAGVNGAVAVPLRSAQMMRQQENVEMYSNPPFYFR